MSAEAMSSKDSPRSRRLLWWAMLGGAGLLLCGLATIVGMTWHRGQLQQRRIETLLRLGMDINIYQRYSRYEYVPRGSDVSVLSGSSGLHNHPDIVPAHARRIEPILGEQCYVHSTKIVVSRESFADAHVPLLLAFRELPELEIYASGLTDDGFRQLVALKRLVVLRAPHVRLSAGTVRQLSECRELRELWINTSLIEAEVVSELQRELPDCRVEVWPPPSFGMQANMLPER